MDVAISLGRNSSKILRLGVGSILRKEVSRCSIKLSETYPCKFRGRALSTVFPSSVSLPLVLKDSATQDSRSSFATRTHTCGELTANNVGETVCLKGWLQFNRSHFLILRDAHGTTQILLDHLKEDMKTLVDSLTLESVIEVRGEVSLRPQKQINSEMNTGEIEVKASYISVLGSAPSQLPLSIKGKKMPTEQVRMRYRYLYLRYPHMQKMLRLRSNVIHAMRQYLVQNHFVDVETPTLFKKTPGGAQEFVVPTQKSGLFYSLVQSPQQFKQLLMVGGLDRYFQVARCYRDETVRYDRQPEFTQLDIELSFTDHDGVMSLIEELLRFCMPADFGAFNVPFQRMKFHDAMQDYGSDKPDLRFDSKILDVTHLINSNTKEKFKAGNKKQNFAAKAILFPGAASVCKKDQLNEIKKEAHAQSNVNSTNLHILPITKDLHSSRLRTFLSSDDISKIKEETKPSQGDLFIICLGPENDILKLLGLTRVLTANILEANDFPVRDKNPRFLWVVDFPLFEEADDGSLCSAHHPFTQPHPDDMHLLNSNPFLVRGLHYDLVLNGWEIGGGSIRISDAQLQRHILHDMLHLDSSSFQHLLDALSYGCPPHGGIAIGIDRLISIICGAKSLREVIAFPKALEGKDMMAGAPAHLSEEDAKFYKLQIVSDKNL